MAEHHLEDYYRHFNIAANKSLVMFLCETTLLWPWATISIELNWNLARNDKATQHLSVGKRSSVFHDTVWHDIKKVVLNIRPLWFSLSLSVDTLCELVYYSCILRW